VHVPACTEYYFFLVARTDLNIDSSLSSPECQVHAYADYLFALHIIHSASGHERIALSLLRAARDLIAADIKFIGEIKIQGRSSLGRNMINSGFFFFSRNGKIRRKETAREIGPRTLRIHQTARCEMQNQTATNCCRDRHKFFAGHFFRASRVREWHDLFTRISLSRDWVATGHCIL